MRRHHRRLSRPSTRRAAVVVGAAATVAALAGCNLAEPPGSTAGEGDGETVVIGSSPTLRPLEYLDEDNEPTGLVIDLLTEAATEQGKQVRFEQMSFDALIPALQAGRIDMITSMGDLPERRGTVTFLDYLESGAAMLVPAGNPLSVAGPEDLCGIRVAFTRGSSQQEFTESASQDCLDGGGPAVDSSSYQGASESILALRSDQTDGAWTDRVNAAFLMEESPDTYEIGYIEDGAGYGVGFPIEDEELREDFTGALETMLENGRYAELVEEYGLQESILEEFTVNQGQGIGIPDAG